MCKISVAIFLLSLLDVSLVHARDELGKIGLQHYFDDVEKGDRGQIFKRKSFFI